MKIFFKLFGIIAIVAVIGFTMIACNKSGGSSGNDSSKSIGGGGKSFNSAEELKEYLDKQPVNGPDKPIKVSMTINDPMLKSVADVIKSAGKYVSLNITGNALSNIPNGAFINCETLVNIIIPDSVTSIGEEAFSGCTSLTSVTIVNDISSIGNSAFAECTSLTNITIPNNVTIIGYAVFMNCSSLTNITIPDSVTSIRLEAFTGCTSLTSITFQGTITSYELYYDWSYKYNFPISSFYGDLREKYLAGGIGTYTTTAPVKWDSVWTKK